MKNSQNKKTKEELIQTSHGTKLKELFNEIGLDILKIKKENFVPCRLPFEYAHYDEYRCTFGEFFTKEMLDDEYSGETTEVAVLKTFGENALKEYLQDLKKIGSVIATSSNNDLTFSFFLPKTVNISKDIELTKLAAWQSAYQYFIVLKNSITDLYQGNIHEWHEILTMDGF